MAIEDVKQLRTENGITQAQRWLDQGWVILAVCVIQDGSSQYAEYHLGNTAPKVAREAESITLGAHVTG